MSFGKRYKDVAGSVRYSVRNLQAARRRKGMSEESGEACPECGSNKLQEDPLRGEIICSKCGYVLQDRLIDTGPEWRAFDSDQRRQRERTGAPATYSLHDKGLSSVIDKRDVDITGKRLTPKKTSQFYRLRRWDSRSKMQKSKDRHLVTALADIERIAGLLDLPKNIREAASLLYRQVVERGLARGRSIELLSAAVIYVTCRRFRVPRTLEEIADATKLTSKEVGRSYRFVCRRLDISLPPVSPVDYVPRFGSALGIPEPIQQRSIEILRKVISMGIGSGKGPMGIAASALYWACLESGYKKTQKEVAKAAGVTEVTIRNRFKEIAELLDQGA
jgi:transcription initiation factor TFIIB